MDNFPVGPYRFSDIPFPDNERSKAQSLLIALTFRVSPAQFTDIERDRLAADSPSHRSFSHSSPPPETIRSFRDRPGWEGSDRSICSKTIEERMGRSARPRQLASWHCESGSGAKGEVSIATSILVCCIRCAHVSPLIRSASMRSANDGLRRPFAAFSKEKIACVFMMTKRESRRRRNFTFGKWRRSCIVC